MNGANTLRNSTLLKILMYNYRCHVRQPYKCDEKKNNAQHKFFQVMKNCWRKCARKRVSRWIYVCVSVCVFFFI